jgi:hypothetical protein
MRIDELRGERDREECHLGVEQIRDHTAPIGAAVGRARVIRAAEPISVPAQRAYAEENEVAAPTMRTTSNITGAARKSAASPSAEPADVYNLAAGCAERCQEAGPRSSLQPRRQTEEHVGPGVSIRIVTISRYAMKSDVFICFAVSSSHAAMRWPRHQPSRPSGSNSGLPLIGRGRGAARTSRPCSTPFARSWSDPRSS